MRKICVFLCLLTFFASTATAGEALFGKRLAAIKTMQEQVDGYVIKVNLELFNNNPQNIEVDFADSSVSVVGHYVKEDTNASGSVSKIFTFTKPVDENKFSKKQEGDEIIIFVPFQEGFKGDSFAKTHEDDLIKAKENFNKTLEQGLSYNAYTTRNGADMRAKVYHQGKNTRTELRDGSYMIASEKDEDGMKKIIWYSSKDNSYNVQSVAEDASLEKIYIDSPKNYSLYIKGTEVNIYDLPCVMYSKTDANKTVNVCVNVDTGIILFEEVVGVYKKEISSIVVGDLPINTFYIPVDAIVRNL